MSVGEVSATRALVRLLSDDGSSPPVRVVISSTTDTGVARAGSMFGANHPVVRFPFDFSWMVRRFVEAIRPDLVVLMELELWPHLLVECERRGIPTCVMNGRLSESSFRRYSRFRRLMRPMFGRLSAVGAQTEEYARRFVDLGVPKDRVRITDTMKWDNVELRASVPGAAKLAAALGIDRTRPLVVAGSTGPGEEQMLLASRPPGVQLLLVPRKPERFEEVAGLDREMVRRTDRPAGRSPPPEGKDTFLVDTMGELEKAYALADVVVVGRSFSPLGGSDPIPPVALGRPTVIGPHHQNFRQVVADLEGAGGLIVSDQPMRTVKELLGDPGHGRSMVEKGQSVIRAHQGASRRSEELVLGLLREEASAGAG